MTKAVSNREIPPLLPQTLLGSRTKTLSKSIFWEQMIKNGDSADLENNARTFESACSRK